MAGGIVSSPSVRNDPPDPDDWGIVVRPIGGITGGLTDAELRASAVAVSIAGVATETTLALIKAKTDNLDVALSTRAVTGLTDTQLRATPVPVSGTVSTGGLTDTQLRASAVSVSQSSQPLPTGASTEATLALIKAKTDNLDVALSTRAVTGLTDTQLRAAAVPISGTVNTGGLTDTQLRATSLPVSQATQPLPTGAATESTISAALGPAIGTPMVCTAATTDVHTPAAGKAIRLKYLGIFAPDDNAQEVIVTVKLGATTIYQLPIGQFGHRTNREGIANAKLVIELSPADVALPVYVNPELEEFTP